MRKTERVWYLLWRSQQWQQKKIHFQFIWNDKAIIQSWKRRIGENETTNLQSNTISASDPTMTPHSIEYKDEEDEFFSLVLD